MSEEIKSGAAPEELIPVNKGMQDNSDANEAAAPAEERENIISLSTPYRFEGKEYTEIDLRGLDKLTIQDAIDIQLDLFNGQEEAAALICETTTSFAREIAARASGLPVEFFGRMPRGLTKKLSRTIRGFLSVGKETVDHVMRLEKPYSFKGETYEEIDLNGLTELTSLNESAAENRLARAGFMITETTFNHLYACCLSSMATGLPEAFFTGLPLREAVKLRTAVNDQSFFE